MLGKLSLLILFLVAGFAFADSSLNVSARGQRDCAAAVTLYADLVLGPSVVFVVRAGLTEPARPDGEVTAPDRQRFAIHYREGNQDRKIDLMADGPDTEDRCFLERR